MATNYYIDSLLGSDANLGTNPSAPWETTQNANALNPAGANIIFNFVDNGWTAPYRATGANAAAIAPAYGATTDTLNVEWQCNNAVITGTAKLTGITWTQLPGSTYVYYCDPGWTATPNVLIAVNTEITWIGETAIWLQKIAYTPSDTHDHCWYWDTTTGILYFCDHSGNPTDTGIYLEYGDKDYAIYASAKGNHEIHGARVFPGKVRCMDFNGPYNGFYRNKFFYGGSGALVKLSSSTNFKGIEFQYNLLYGVYQAYSYGLLYLDGAGVEGIPVHIYNNTFYGGNVGVNAAASTGTLEPIVFRNNIFVDQYTSVFTLQGSGGTLALVDEDYNVFGNSRNDVATVVLGVATGSHSVPASALATASTTTDVGIARPDHSMALTYGSPAVNSGTNLGITPDIAGIDVPFSTAPDMGCYELEFVIVAFLTDIPIEEIKSITGVDTIDIFSITEVEI